MEAPTEKQPLLREIISSLMQRIPFGGVVVVKFVLYNKPLILYNKLYNESHYKVFLTICVTDTSLLVFVNKEKIIFPFTTIEEQIEVLKMLKNNGIISAEDEWYSVLNHTPMANALDLCFRFLQEDRTIVLDSPKKMKIYWEEMVINQVVVRSNRMIHLMCDNKIEETLYFQHPHDFFLTAKIVEDNTLFLPYDLLC